MIYSTRRQRISLACSCQNVSIRALSGGVGLGFQPGDFVFDFEFPTLYFSDFLVWRQDGRPRRPIPFLMHDAWIPIHLSGPEGSLKSSASAQVNDSMMT